MDLFQNSGAGVGNMMSQRAEASSQQAFERNKMETQKLQDSVKLAKGQVSQVGEANTMKGIQDAIVGGVLGAKIAPAVKEYRAFHNQRLQVRRDKHPLANPLNQNQQHRMDLLKSRHRR